MNEIQAIAGTITALRTAGEIIKGLYEAKISSDVKEKLSDLQQVVFDARQTALDAQDELTAVKQEVAELKSHLVSLQSWGDDKRRYQLSKIDNISGVVYALKESTSDGEPPHYLCTSCYQRSQKSILANYYLPEKMTIFRCSVCKSEVPTRFRGPVDAKFAPE